jgi:hypothetical protein
LSLELKCLFLFGARFKFGWGLRLGLGLGLRLGLWLWLWFAVGLGLWLWFAVGLGLCLRRGRLYKGPLTTKGKPHLPGLLGGKAQLHGITRKQIAEKRLRVKKPHLALFNGQKVSMGRAQICLKITWIDVAGKPRIAQYQAHGPYLIENELRMIHD